MKKKQLKNQLKVLQTENPAVLKFTFEGKEYQGSPVDCLFFSPADGEVVEIKRAYDGDYNVIPDAVSVVGRNVVHGNIFAITYEDPASMYLGLCSVIKEEHLIRSPATSTLMRSIV